MKPLPGTGAGLLLRARLQRPAPAARARWGGGHEWAAADLSPLARYGRMPQGLAIEFLRPVRLPGRVPLHADRSTGAFPRVSGPALAARGRCTG